MLVDFDVSYNQDDTKIKASSGLVAVVRTAGDGLTGEIPAGLLDLGSLTAGLSGTIPARKANLRAVGFRGNAGLCGSPLPSGKRRRQQQRTPGKMKKWQFLYQ